jgi:hypothetical protein
VKVRHNGSAPAQHGRKAAALAVAIVTLALAIPAPAFAITREEVVARASSWVAKRVGYSQRAFYGGYRRDCSGMVSMAWKLNTSYTSRTIASRARRISTAQLQPGDAVLTPGHVAIFAGWANRRAGTYIALEQSTSRTGAIRRVKRLTRRAVGLRYTGITAPAVLVAAATPAPEPAAAAPAAPVGAPASVSAAGTIVPAP